MGKGFRQGEKFTERIPSQVSFFHELLHVFRGRPAGSRFE